MRLHRFFIKDDSGVDLEKGFKNKTPVTITDKDLLHQWKHVFRFQVGHQLILLDNSGYEFYTQITLLTGIKAELAIIESKFSPTAPACELWLFASLIKKDNFEWVLEKGTEIGVSHFVPVIAERSEKKNFNIERGQKVIKEATEQSGRATLPKLHDIFDLTGALSFAKEKNCDPILALDPEGKQKLDKNIIKNNSNNQKNKVAVFVGPEGGWSKKEMEIFEKYGVSVCNMGSATLRAETASLTSASLLLL